DDLEIPVGEDERDAGLMADTSGDADGDGLSNAEEVNLFGTNPNKSDSDSDGVSDADELAYGTDPNDPDSDGDSFTDGEEFAAGTDATDDLEVPVGEEESDLELVVDTTDDTDNDGLTDAEEEHYHGTNISKADSDGDGLMDGHELSHGTDPNDSDSDSDGFIDGEEFAAGTNATDDLEIPVGSSETVPDLYADTSGDLDGDGLRNAAETNIHGTNPLKADTDSDGINDKQELALKTNPTDADTDADGFTDGEEVASGTDPLGNKEVPVGASESVPGLVADSTNDSDGDGLTDAEEEHYHGTNISKADSDGDGLMDGHELAIGTNANNPDCDGDGYIDGVEFAAITDPLNREEIPVGSSETILALVADTTDDSDSDGLTDAEEIHIHGTNPAIADTDNDGVLDNIELAQGLNPNVADSDQDGFSDGDELSAMTDPLNKYEIPLGSSETLPDLQADSTDDSDGDGLTDAEEKYLFGTNPAEADSDSDQLSDGEEVVQNTNPMESDTDQDGSLDGEELHYGADPLDPEIRLVSFSGYVLYEGRKEGPVYIVVEPSSEETEAVILSTLDKPGPYTLNHLVINNAYRIWAYMDVEEDGDERYQITEPHGVLYKEFTKIKGDLDEQDFLIEDANSAPEDIFLDNLAVNENSSEGTLIGNLEALDSDSDETFIFTLADSLEETVTNSNQYFKIEGAQLKTAKVLDFEQTPSLKLLVQVSDRYEEVFIKEFDIRIVNQFIPILTTTEIYSTDDGFFEAGGRILADGGSQIIRSGLLFGPYPGLSLDSLTASKMVEVKKADDGIINVTLNELEPGRTYFYRTFAENSEGMAYGAERKIEVAKERYTGLWAAAEKISEEWHHLDGFGFFYRTESPWTYHMDLGWIYISESDNGFWGWMPDTGWWWSRTDFFPYLWRSNDQSWIYFIKNLDGFRVFYNSREERLEFQPLESN
ncbi:MAG: hypothetical protein HN675_02475, partial [Opitutae bacterium]|nr:hypothetical protein [Opitutae bacterium]